MEKQNVVYPYNSAIKRTEEYYSAIKRTEALMLATTQMNPKNIMLSERSEPEMGTHYVIPIK